LRILLVEDDQETAAYILRGFREMGHIVDHAVDGQEGLMLATSTPFDAMIIDRMLPGLDGYKLLSMLRAGGDRTPAIFLTALDGIDDRVRGLGIANDYLVKPFAFAELRARVDVMLRSSPTGHTEEMRYVVENLVLDRLKRSVKRAGQTIALQPTEFRLLEYLMRHKGNVVTRTMLLENVWDFNFDPKTNIVETHISRLRAKVDRGFGHELIHTVRGAGYMIDGEA
jgi:two-component system, OmpR family, response regulator